MLCLFWSPCSEPVLHIPTEKACLLPPSQLNLAKPKPIWDASSLFLILLIERGSVSLWKPLVRALSLLYGVGLCVYKLSIFKNCFLWHSCVFGHELVMSLRTVVLPWVTVAPFPSEALHP